MGIKLPGREGEWRIAEEYTEEIILRRTPEKSTFQKWQEGHLVCSECARLTARKMIEVAENDVGSCSFCQSAVNRMKKFAGVEK